MQDNAGTVTNIVLGDVTGESWIYGIGYGKRDKTDEEDGNSPEYVVLRHWDGAKQEESTFRVLTLPRGLGGVPIAVPRGYSTDESIVNTSLDTLKLTLIDTVKSSAFDGFSGVRTRTAITSWQRTSAFTSRSRTGLFRCRRRNPTTRASAYTPIKQRKTAEKSA